VDDKFAWIAPDWFRYKIFKRKKEANVREFQTKEQGRQCKHDVTLRRVHVTNVAVEKQ